jgi:superfamily I DNA and RNA helicase
MPLDVIYGESRNRTVARELARALTGVLDEGTVYLGYPVLATADARVEVDALLVGKEHGVVAFILADEPPADPKSWTTAVDQQDRLFSVLEGSLKRHESLRAGRSLTLEPQTATIFPTDPGEPPADVDTHGGFYGDLAGVPTWLAERPGLDVQTLADVQAAFQRVTTIKPAKRRASVVNPGSRGATLKIIERGIANLDRWQKSAAIETPDGPQRIRGLAGSGKTVVLALKAAYLHTQHPEWNIAFTFHSRALYRQVTDLVQRFTFEHSNDQPDYDRLKIMHSWGSKSTPGIYSVIADALGEVPRDWVYARGKFGMNDAFQGICRELLAVARTEEPPEIFDAVLIDEAQDLPPEFFQLVYAVTADPKRVIWGYDELQKLSEAAMPTTDELFGRGSDGERLVSLTTPPEEPRADIVLPMCYRNTPWALATAHAVGIGVYRDSGLLQHPDEPSLWEDIGYDVVHGELALGSAVTLKRGPRSYPAYFPELLEAPDAVSMHAFESELEQDTWVADQIAANLNTDELDTDDILIVLPDSYTAKTRAPKLARALRRHEIQAHLVGVDSSVDEVFRSGSVAIAHIFRAKGNEAPMVYAIDAHRATIASNEVTRRNTLFTAITRSRAWVRITGWGERMVPLASEIEQVIAESFQLSFAIPTSEQLAEIRHIHRERPEGYETNLRRATANLTAFLRALEAGELDWSDLPPELWEKVQAMSEGTTDDDEIPQ